MGLKEQIENHPVIIYATVFIFTACAAVPITWLISEKLQVNPRDQKIANLKEQVAKYEQYIRDLNTANEPSRKQIEQLLTNNKTLENNIVVSQSNFKYCQDAIELWKTQNSELQKTLNIYMTNCNIISEVRALDTRKSRVDESITKMYSQDQIEKFKRESDDLQACMLSIQQHLTCLPK